MTGSSTTLLCPQRASPIRNGFDDVALPHHPDLDRAYIEIGEDSVDLCCDELRRHAVDRATRPWCSVP